MYMWQIKHLNLTDVKIFHNFCVKRLEIGHILYYRGSIIFLSPCRHFEIFLKVPVIYIFFGCKEVFLNHNTGWQKNNGPPNNTKYGLFLIFLHKSYEIFSHWWCLNVLFATYKPTNVKFFHNFCVKRLEIGHYFFVTL